jgi:hypothetical protein
LIGDGLAEAFDPTSVLSGRMTRSVVD